MIEILCKIGIHRPLTKKQRLFTDTVSGKAVFGATCPCGKSWLTDSMSRWTGFKCRRHEPKH